MNMKRRFINGRMFRITLKDAAVSLGILTAAAAFCALLHYAVGKGEYSSTIFILAVFLIARFTDGYLCGIISSFIGVLAVNYMFTFPYLSFNFTLAGYPLTILCMLAVSIATSALTSRAKESVRMCIEAEKEKTRSNLLRAVSHDLRTPLTSISGALCVIREDEGKLGAEEREELLRSAQEDAQWLIRMVENLLTVTRIDGENQGGVIKVPETVEDIVSGAVIKFRKRFPGVELCVNIPDECLMVPVDAVLIEQVLLNLFENAVLHGKHTDRITLSVSEAEGKAVFDVADNGAGIDNAKIAHLFDGYLLGSDETGGDRKRNMGIGLSVCNAIIQAHGGVMHAKNMPGGGAVFEFILDL